MSTLRGFIRRIKVTETPQRGVRQEKGVLLSRRGQLGRRRGGDRQKAEESTPGNIPFARMSSGQMRLWQGGKHQWQGLCRGGWKWKKRRRPDLNRKGTGAREAQRNDSEGQKRGYQARRNMGAIAIERWSEQCLCPGGGG